jgi:hypothetical protein
VQPRQEDQRGNLSAIAAQSAPFVRTRWEKDHVQRDIVVSTILGMAVGVPVGRMEMNFDVTGNRDAIDTRRAFMKIRPTKQVPCARRADKQTATVGQPQAGLLKILAQPDFLHDAFGDRERTIQALHLLHLFMFHSHRHKLPHGPATCGLNTAGILPTRRDESQTAEPRYVGIRTCV